MLNSNSGIDHSSARAFGSSFPAGQNQNGANAFGLAGASCYRPKTFILGKTVVLSNPNVQAAYQDSRITTCRQAYKIGKLRCCSPRSRNDWIPFYQAVYLSTGKPCYIIALSANVSHTALLFCEQYISVYRQAILHHGTGR